MTEKKKVPKDEEGAPKTHEDRWKWIQNEFKIDKKMLPIKAAIFMYVGGVTAFLPFLTLHMQEIGLVMEQIAIIYAVLPIASIIGPTVSGVIADKLGRYTFVLSLNILLTGFFHTTLLFVPPSTTDILQLQCGSEVSVLNWRECNETFVQTNQTYPLTIQNCVFACETPPAEFNLCFSADDSNSSSCIRDVPKDFSMKINASLSNIDYSNCSQSLFDIHYKEKMYDEINCPNDCSLVCRVQNIRYNGNPEDEKSSNTTFYIYFILRIIATMTLTSCFSMLDAVVLAKVKESGGDFGKQRMMIMVGQAIIPLIAGVLVDYTNGESIEINYAPAFYLGDALLLTTTVILMFMSLKVEAADDNILKNMTKIISRIEIDVFLLIITFLGMNWGFLETYLFLYLKELGAPTYLLGLTLTVGCASGLPAMFWSDGIVEKLGRTCVFFMSFVAYFIRFVGYSYISDPWYCFPFELLEVITYQIMWVAAATYCPILAPAGLLATMTGIAGAAHYSLGRGLGSFVGGYFIAWYGLRKTFRGFGYVALGGAFVYLLIHKFVLERKIEMKTKILKLAEMQGLQPRSDRASMDILAVMQNSSRRNSSVM